MSVYPLGKQKMIALETMVVYNFIREHQNCNLDFDRVERDEDYEPTIPEIYNKSVDALDGPTSLYNTPIVNVFRDELATTITQCWN